ncbi:MAG: glycosyltransferase [Streptosporangiaceae bacterium]
MGAVAVLSLIVWVCLVTLHGGFWRTDQRLPPQRGEIKGAWPSVTAIVPARNEATTLPGTLPTLVNQDYPAEFTVLVVDDNSDDDTAMVAKDLGATVITSSGPEPGWAGKVNAMAQGLARASTEYVLFTDADIAWKPGALRALVASAGDRALVSQMVRLRTSTQNERALIPAFVYFFAQLYPFRRVNDPGNRTAAAAGGCMLARRDALPDGLEPVKNALIDDVAIATMVKRPGRDVWLGLTTDITSERPYPGLRDLWQMIARSAYTQLNYNPLILLGTVAGLVLIYLIPPAATSYGAIAGDPLATAAGAAGWLLMTASYLPMLRFYRLSPLRAPTLPLIALAYTAMTIDSARRHYARAPVQWRGPRP